MENKVEGGSFSNVPDNGSLFLLAKEAEREGCWKQTGKEVEAERERASLFPFLKCSKQTGKCSKQTGKEMEAERERAALFPFLKSTRYGSKALGWPEAVVRCHAMLPLVKSVCVKKLTATDTASHHNRLLFRREDVHDLVFKELREPERRAVCEEGGKGLLVPTLDEAGRPWALVLIYWSSNGAYVLKKEWSKLADSNGFHAHIDIEIFSFRQRTSGRLCFVVIRRSPATGHAW